LTLIDVWRFLRASEEVGRAETERAEARRMSE